MIQLFGTGSQRVFYRAIGFQTGVTVTAYLWSPTLVKSALQTLTEIEEGLYYLDYNFTSLGAWPVILMEEGAKTVFETIRIEAGVVDIAAVADAIWDELKSGHTIAGTFGKYLDIEVSSRASALTGAYQVTLQLYKTATVTPIPDVGISVWNADQSVLMGAVLTDSSGSVAFGRENGTYKLICEKAGYSFTTPETLVVSGANKSQTIYGTEWSAPTAPTVYTCIVYGWLRDLDNTGLSGKTISAKLHKTPVHFSGVAYSAIQSASDITDGSGYFELTLTRSRYMQTATGDAGRYQLTIGESKLIWTIEVPDQSSVKFGDCPRL